MDFFNFNKTIRPAREYLIEVGSNYARFALVSRNKERLTIESFSSFSVPGDSSDNVFWARFKQHLEQFYKSEVRSAHLIVSPNYIASCAKVLPSIPKAEAVSHCMHVISHDMRIVPGEYYLDHNVTKLENKDLMAGMVTGIKTVVSDKLLDILNKTGIDLERIETSVLSMENMFVNLKLMPKESTALALRLEDNFCELIAMKERAVTYYEVVKFGIFDIKKSIARTVYTKAAPIEIDFDETEDIVNNIGYPEGEGSYTVKSDKRTNILEKAGHPAQKEGSLDISYQQLRMLFAPALDVLSEKVGTFMSEYLKNFQNKEKISAIYLIGKGAKIKGLGNFLEQRLKVPQIYLNLVKISERIDPGPQIPESVDLDELNLLPATLFDALKHYNLISQYYKIIKETHKAKNTVYIYAGVLAGFLLFFSLGLNLNMFYLKRITYRAEQSYSELMPLIKKLGYIGELNSEITSLEAKISSAYSSYRDWLGVLKELSRLTSNEIVLNKFSGSSESGKNTAVIQGSVEAERSSLNTVLNNFIKRIKESAYFKDAKIVDTQHKSNLNQIYFKIECYLN